MLHACSHAVEQHVTDLEITKLCAEAMGYTAHPITGFGTQDDMIYVQEVVSESPSDRHFYQPLHNDAQAMALVKKFKLNIMWSEHGWWAVRQNDITALTSRDEDLNRAICECVAKMQLDRQFAQPHHGHD